MVAWKVVNQTRQQLVYRHNLRVAVVVVVAVAVVVVVVVVVVILTLKILPDMKLFLKNSVKE